MYNHSEAKQIRSGYIWRSLVYNIIGGKGKSGRKQGSKQNGEDEGKQIDADNGSTYDFIDGVTGCV